MNRLNTEQEKELLTKVATTIKTMIPDGYGFTLIVVPVGVDLDNGGQFISDLKRDSVPALLRMTADRLQKNLAKRQ